MRANYFLRKINHFVVVVVAVIIINLLSFDIPLMDLKSMREEKLERDWGI